MISRYSLAGMIQMGALPIKYNLYIIDSRGLWTRVLIRESGDSIIIETAISANVVGWLSAG